MRKALFMFLKVGNVAIARVANFLLCTYSKETVGLGLLKAKVTVDTLILIYSLDCNVK